MEKRSETLLALLEKENELLAIEKEIEKRVQEQDVYKRQSLYAPREAVTQGKQVRILRTAALYLQGHPTDLQPRFDVIEVVTRKGRPMEAVEIDHLLGAYEAADLHTSF